MENKTIKFIQVEQDIHIGGSSTSVIVDKFNRLISRGIIDTSKAILCTINYVVMDNKIEDAPVNIYFLDGTRLRLNLTAGYGGTGPNCTCKILEICGFDFNKQDILSQQDVVDIKYHKDIDENIVYQFINIDGSHEYSNL